MVNRVFIRMFIAGLMIYWFAILGPRRLKTKRNAIAEPGGSMLNSILSFAAFLGMQLLPMVYGLTSWLDFADTALPALTGWVGALLFASALLIMARAYTDLGRNWSMTLELREEHELITRGIYAVIRHPIYAALWLWAIAQVLMLHNWIVGPAGLFTCMVVYLERVPREERMMVAQFGDAYRAYMARTGRVLPRLKRKPPDAKGSAPGARDLPSM